MLLTFEIDNYTEHIYSHLHFINYVIVFLYSITGTKTEAFILMYVHQFSHDSNDASSGVIFDDTLMKMFTLLPSDKALLPL